MIQKDKFLYSFEIEEVNLFKDCWVKKNKFKNWPLVKNLHFLSYTHETW